MLVNELPFLIKGKFEISFSIMAFVFIFLKAILFLLLNNTLSLGDSNSFEEDMYIYGVLIGFIGPSFSIS